MFNWDVDSVTENSGLPEQLCKTMLGLGWRYVEELNKPPRWEAYGLSTRLPGWVKQQLIGAGWLFYKKPTVRWVHPSSMIGMDSVV